MTLARRLPNRGLRSPPLLGFGLGWPLRTMTQLPGPRCKVAGEDGDSARSCWAHRTLSRYGCLSLWRSPENSDFWYEVGKESRATGTDVRTNPVMPASRARIREIFHRTYSASISNNSIWSNFDIRWRGYAQIYLVTAEAGGR